jgi:hypothetical protein
MEAHMKQTEILKELKKLSREERLKVIHDAIHLLQEDLHQIEQPLARMERKRRLSAAAKVLLLDYKKDDELISFTALDGEDFHAQG